MLGGPTASSCEYGGREVTVSENAVRGSTSDGQKLMWWMEHAIGSPGVMNVPLIHRLRGELSLPALHEALNRLVARHESLRTRFEAVLDVPEPELVTQVVSPPWPVDLECVDVSTADDPFEAAFAAIRDRLVRNIEVLAEPSFTLDLFRLAEDDHLFMINVHHLVTDAWSNMVLWRDLGAFYNEAAGDPGAQLPPVEWTFRHFVDWQRERVQTPARAAKHGEFWHRALGEARFVDLRPIPERSAGRLPPCENVWFAVEGEQRDRLLDLVRSERTTEFVIMLAALYGVLHTMTGEDSVALGSVFANRPRREVYDSAGFFANLVVLGVDLPEGGSFRDLVGAVRRTVLQVLAHQEYPYLYTLTDPITRPAALRAAETVFHMIAVPESINPPDGVPFTGLDVERYPIPDGMGSRFDLELLIIPRRDGYDGVIRYTGDRYQRPLMDQLARCYQDLIDAVGRQPDRPLATIPALAAHRDAARIAVTH